MDDRRDIARRRGYDRGLMLSVLFLVGDAFVTGQTLAVNGGALFL